MLMEGSQRRTHSARSAMGNSGSSQPVAHLHMHSRWQLLATNLDQLGLRNGPRYSAACSLSKGLPLDEMPRAGEAPINSSISRLSSTSFSAKAVASLSS